MAEQEEPVTQEEELAQIAEEEAAAEPEIVLPETPLFGKYSSEDVEVVDPGLQRYVKLELVGLPHSSARHANRRFGKARLNVVERLLNNVMRGGAYNGKKGKAYKVVEDAFARIADKTGDNPLQVYVTAVENGAPREEVTRLRYGGINVPKAVDVAPLRRLDLSIRNLAKGGLQGSHKSTKPVHVCLSDEIMKAAKNDQGSFAVSKKDETERVAKSAR